ncbi:hypothetical protein BH09SUM1_BH09SUM1_05180 [soil metagenome]
MPDNQNAEMSPLFPTALRKSRWLIFFVLAGIAILETRFAIPTWNIAYPLLHDRLAFLSSFFAAAEQFASATAFVTVGVFVWTCHRTRRRTLVALALSILLASAVTDVVKIAAGRARPAFGVLMSEKNRGQVKEYLETHANPILKPEPGDYWMWFSKDRPGAEFLRVLTGEFDHRKLKPFGEYDSFPSGHATSAFVLGTFLVLVFPRGRFWWYALSFGCALARVRFRRHYPADVLMGGAIGWIAVQVIFSCGLPFHWGDRIAAWADSGGRRWRDRSRA